MFKPVVSNHDIKGELRFQDRIFTVRTTDKIVVGFPREFFVLFQCPQFVVFQKHGSLQRAYMLRKHALKRIADRLAILASNSSHRGI